jgi:hypothetical protein
MVLTTPVSVLLISTERPSASAQTLIIAQLRLLMVDVRRYCPISTLSLLIDTA